MKKILSIRGLSFSYKKDRPVLNNVDLEIEEGTVTGILGRNGCGKSTLFNTIIGYHDNFTGEILINGDPILSLTPSEFSRRAAYVPQSSNINIDFTVFEYILFGRNCHMRFGSSPSENDWQLVYRYADQCGITGLLKKNINSVSGGERQLACIARALVQESPLILMDEPASALDFGNHAKLLRMIKALQESGKTIIFTTHDPNDVTDLDCNAAIVSDGRILLHGRAGEIITFDLLTRIYGEEIELFRNRMYGSVNNNLQ